MPFWKTSQKYYVSGTPKKGNPKSLIPSEIPSLEEPNVRLLKYTILNDTVDEPSSHESHSPPGDQTTTTKKGNCSLLARLRSKINRERRPDSRAVFDPEEIEEHFPGGQLKIHVATWNMEGKDFPQDLQSLLQPSEDDIPNDIYVIGVQEGCKNRHQWEQKLQETLGPMYSLHHSSGHGVMYLSVFVRRNIIRFCSEVEHAYITTRIFHHVKTKGALGVTLRVLGTSFLFITTHMRFGAVEKRIEDYKTITEGLRLPKTRKRSDPNADITNKFQHVFWFGDLNFQLQENRTTVESLLENIQGTDMSSLMIHDSLNHAKRNGSIFQGFREHTISFRPTYKFDIGTDNFDSSEKQRIPSYTDRVLYKTKYEEDVQVLRYDSCPLLKTSDHRPVFAIFAVKLRPDIENICLAGGDHHN